MANKVTERDIYNAMINGTIDAETMKAFAEKKIAQLDKRNESAKVRAAKKRAAGNELVELVYSYVGDAATRAQITDAMIADGHDVTVAKVGARLNILASDGRIVKEKGKVVGEDGKARVAMLYSLAE